MKKNNKGVSWDNPFIKVIQGNGSRWGNSWGDNIHFDAGLNAQILSKYNKNFESIKEENQNQYSTGTIYSYKEKEK